MWSIHTIKYYSALKREEILTHATTQIDFESIMLSDIRQSQKTTILVLGGSQIHGTESRKMVASFIWGVGSCLIAIEFQF